MFSSCTKESRTNDKGTFESTLDLNSVIDLENGLVGYYPFNGNTLDSSGHHNSVIFNNATPTKDRFGNRKGAYLFNGVDNYMQVPNSPSLNPTKAITLFAIVKVLGFYQGACHSNRILCKGNGDFERGQYKLEFNDARYWNNGQCDNEVKEKKENFAGWYGDDSNVVVAQDTAYIKLRTWYKIAYTYDGQVAKFYVDGILRNAVSISATFTPNNDDLFFGKLNYLNYYYWFNGIIDEIRIYNKALTAHQIKNLSQ